ncbi:MAG: alpha/beta fold hydrolase, partial [Planctomycetota bacterium]
MAGSRRLEAVTFEGGDGRTIAGWLDLPPDAPRAYALLAHCFSCTKDFPAVARVGRRLAERGFGVLRFDFSGHGVLGFARGRADALAAAAWLRTRHGPPRLLVGHSFGGAVLASAAAEIPEAGALATIAATADPAALRSRVCSRLRAEDEQHWELEIGGRRFAVAPELCRELEDPELLDRVARFRGAALVLHDPEDPVVPYAEAERLFSRLGQPRGLVALPGAGHLLAAPEAARHAAD